MHVFTRSDPSTTAYPAGQAATASPGNGVVIPSSGMPSAPTSDIEFVGRTTDFLNGAISNQMNVFTFHNSLSDALASRDLGRYGDTSRFMDLLQSSPSDWQSKFGSSPDGLGLMFDNLQGLTDLAHSVWMKQASPLGPASSWNLQGVDSFDDYVRQSQASNVGTEKEGMANHPDYAPMRYAEAHEDSELTPGDLIFGYNAGKAGMNMFQKGSTALQTSEGTATLGEEALISVGEEVGEGAIVAAETAGTVAGVGLVAAGTIGLAIAGYEVYKSFGGTGRLPLLDSIGSIFGHFI